VTTKTGKSWACLHKSNWAFYREEEQGEGQAGVREVKIYKGLVSVTVIRSAVRTNWQESKAGFHPHTDPGSQQPCPQLLPETNSKFFDSFAFSWVLVCVCGGGQGTTPQG
jgi:hypothetical protein